MSEILQAIIGFVAPILATTLGSTVLWFAQRKLHLSVTAEQQAMTRKVVDDAVHAAEEWARDKAKREGGIVPSGRQKMDAAKAYADSVLSRLGLPKLAPPEAEAALQAALGAMREAS